VHEEVVLQLHTRGDVVKVERTGEVPAEDEVGRSGVSSSSMEGSLFNVREYFLQHAVCK
jgi:hypothetical protein